MGDGGDPAAAAGHTPCRYFVIAQYMTKLEIEVSCMGDNQYSSQLCGLSSAIVSPNGG